MKSGNRVFGKDVAILPFCERDPFGVAIGASHIGARCTMGRFRGGIVSVRGIIHRFDHQEYLAWAGLYPREWSQRIDVA